MGAEAAGIMIIGLVIVTLALVFQPAQTIDPPDNAYATYIVDDGKVRVRMVDNDLAFQIPKIPFISKDSQFGFYYEPYQYTIRGVSSDGIPMTAEISYYGERKPTAERLKQIAIQRGDISWQGVDAHELLDNKVKAHFGQATAVRLDKDGMAGDGWVVGFSYTNKEDQIDAWAREDAQTVAQFSPWPNSYSKTYEDSRSYYRKNAGLDNPVPTQTIDTEYHGQMIDGQIESQEQVNAIIEQVLAEDGIKVN